MDNTQLIFRPISTRRASKVRSAIINLLTDRHPLSIPQIAAALTADDLVPNKTTLYREMSTLIADNVVRKIDLGDQMLHYELANLPHHHHAVCLRCRNVTDVALEHELDAAEQVLRSSGFQLTYHSLEFFGLCLDCQPQ